jgi:hypothetical protein
MPDARRLTPQNQKAIFFQIIHKGKSDFLVYFSIIG